MASDLFHQADFHRVILGVAVSSAFATQEKPISVLLWSTQGAGLHYGGPGMTAYRLYSRAEEGRFKIALAHAFGTQERHPLFSEIHQIAPPTNSPLAALRYLRSAKEWLSKNARRFDVFHGLRAFHETVAPALAAQRLGLPAVVKPAAFQADIADKNGLSYWLGLQRQRRDMLKSLSGVIAISCAIADELLLHGIPERKIARIPNGVDTGLFRPAGEGVRRRQRSDLGWRDMPTLLFVGAVLPRKRPHLLIEAVAIAKQKGFECQLVIAGPLDHDAQYVAGMKQKAEELGCAHLLVLSGFRSDVSPLYRGADIFGFPSSREGMPNALLEAMASGLPAIITPFAGYQDISGEDAIGQVAEATPGALAEALVTYLRAPELRRAHGQAGRARAESRFSTDAVLNAHERLFRRVISGKDAAE
jgi:glycosyltransferase involved in cell wall biosynthesis